MSKEKERAKFDKVKQRKLFKMVLDSSLEDFQNFVLANKSSINFYVPSEEHKVTILELILFKIIEIEKDVLRLQNSSQNIIVKGIKNSKISLLIRKKSDLEEKIKILIDIGFDIDHLHQYQGINTTLLHKHCRKNDENDSNIKIITKLLALKARVNIFDSLDLSPLACVALQGGTGAFKLLMEYGASPDTFKHLEASAQFFAIRNLSWEIIELILGKSKRINMADEHGKTLLHHLVSRESKKIRMGESSKNAQKIFQMLLEAGASLKLENKSGKRPFGEIHPKGEIGGFKRKIQQYLDSCGTVELEGLIVPNLSQLDLDVVDANEEPIIHKSLREEKFSFALQMIIAGADIDVKSFENITLLDHLVTRLGVLPKREGNAMGDDFARVFVMLLIFSKDIGAIRRLSEENMALDLVIEGLALRGEYQGLCGSKDMCPKFFLRDLAEYIGVDSSELQPFFIERLNKDMETQALLRISAQQNNVSSLYNAEAIGKMPVLLINDILQYTANLLPAKADRDSFRLTCQDFHRAGVGGVDGVKDSVRKKIINDIFTQPEGKCIQLKDAQNIAKNSKQLSA